MAHDNDAPLTPPPSQFGAIVFDEPALHREGWIATADPESEPRRISSTAEVTSACVCLTNLNWDLSAASGYSDHARYRRADFLRSSGSGALVAELGVRNNPREVARITASLFYRLMVLSNLYGLREIPKDSLQRGLGASIRAMLKARDDTPLCEAIKQAQSPYTRTERPAHERDQLIRHRFMFPRLTHALELLREARVPSLHGEWSLLDPKSLPRSIQGDKIIEWIDSVEAETRPAPILAKIELRRFEPAIAPLINFGSGLMPSATRRDWVSTPELRLLAQWGEIRVKAAYVCRQSGRMPGTEALESLIAPVKLQADGKSPGLAYASISLGLFAENVWRGLISGTQAAPNPMAPFLRAYDRIRCLAMAMRLRDLGFSISGYGSGAIDVAVAPDIPFRLIYETAAEFGLTVAASVQSPESARLTEIEFLEIAQHPATTQIPKLVELLYAHQDTTRLMNLDEATIRVLVDSHAAGRAVESARSSVH